MVDEAGLCLRQRLVGDSHAHSDVANIRDAEGVLGELAAKVGDAERLAVDVHYERLLTPIFADKQTPELLGKRKRLGLVKLGEGQRGAVFRWRSTLLLQGQLDLF